MPELPEVHTIVEYLRSNGCVGSRIRSVDVLWERSAVVDPREPGVIFVQALTGRTIGGIHRRGKQIVITMDQGWALLIHLRMSGLLYLGDTGSDPYVRVCLHLSRGGALVFRDPRKFGRCIVTRHPERYLEALGVEPLDPLFGPDNLAAVFHARSRALKPLLLDQTVIAGLGNIYTDESLWHARLHPLTPAGSLHRPDVVRLAASIQHVLRQGIKHRGTRLGSGTSNFGGPAPGWEPLNQHHLNVFHRAGMPCPRCGTAVVRTVVAQRGTSFCPQCQLRRRDSGSR